MSLFTCRLLKAICGWKTAEIEEASRDGRTRGAGTRESGWSVKKGKEEEQAEGWATVRLMLEESGRGWLGKLLPRQKREEKWNPWVGENRTELNRIGGLILGEKRRKIPTKVEEVFVSVAMSAVIAWNITTYPQFREDIGEYARYVDPWISVFNLRQYWAMFAPAPYADDWWWIGIGVD